MRTGFEPLVVTGALAMVMASACRSFTPPPPGVPERAQAARTYSASLRITLKSPSLRGRAAVIVAFARPHALRLEVPGPSGARCVAVADASTLRAVFPGAGAYFEATPAAVEMEALLGVHLTPPELMDLLTGAPSPQVRDYRASWGGALPRKVSAVLEDGSRLEAVVESADLDPSLPEAAFALPSLSGLRPVDAAEARRLLGIR